MTEASRKAIEQLARMLSEMAPLIEPEDWSFARYYEQKANDCRSALNASDPAESRAALEEVCHVSWPREAPWFHSRPTPEENDRAERRFDELQSAVGWLTRSLNVALDQPERWKMEIGPGEPLSYTLTVLADELLRMVDEAHEMVVQFVSDDPAEQVRLRRLIADLVALRRSFDGIFPDPRPVPAK